VSNIHSVDDLKIHLDIIPKHVTIVPKIESVDGVANVEQITDALGNNKILMLDHDDLYLSITKSKQPALKFLECFNKLVDHCNNHNVVLLRTIGVIFSDQERRITDYVG
jgi:citrate lyase beta subunit